MGALAKKVFEVFARPIAMTGADDRPAAIAPVTTAQESLTTKGGAASEMLEGASRTQHAPETVSEPSSPVDRETAPTPEVIEATYQRFWLDYAVRDGTYTPEELRQVKKVVKPWGPVKTYRLVAVKQYSEPLGCWLFVITEASGDVPPDARFLTPVAGGRALAWLTAEQLPHAACLPPAAVTTPEAETA